MPEYLKNTNSITKKYFGVNHPFTKTVHAIAAIVISAGSAVSMMSSFESVVTSVIAECGIGFDEYSIR